MKVPNIRLLVSCLMLGICLFVHFAAKAALLWEERFHDGVTVSAYALEKPRIMKVFVARVDLTTPGISFTSTERLKDGWREPIRMADSSTDGKYLAETQLESTADFMMRRRSLGMNVVLAANAAFWKPWPQPDNENRADPIGLCISDGIEVSADTTDYDTGTFVVYRNGKVDIVPLLDEDKREETAVAVSGLPIIMKDGQFTNPDDSSIHPRTAFGLTADRKTFVILVVDGRQTGYSEGASLNDLYDIMRRLGVADAVNMDGGGSSSLVVFDAKQDGARMLNQHAGGAVRNVAFNLGVAFGESHDDGDSTGGSTSNSNIPWLNENAFSLWSGEWSQGIGYDSDGKAFIEGTNTFTPYIASTGNVVTVEMTAQFKPRLSKEVPDTAAQTAVQLSTNGCFQVWTRKELGIESGGVGELGWVDVEAQGVTPISGAEYTLRFSFNYSTGTYSVDLKQNDAWLPLSTSTLNSSTHPLSQSSTSNFLLATAANCVSSISFVGDTLFTSLSGDCRMVVIGFAENETVVLKDNAVAILDAAKAAWLNKCAGGDKAAAGSAAAGLTGKEFNEAYLLNLDIADGERSYSFAIADVKVGDENVTVSVTLKRAGIAGGEAAPINGTLKFYGDSTLEAFKNASSAAIETTNLTDGDFSKSDTATAKFPKGENKFFKAKIEE